MSEDTPVDSKPELPKHIRMTNELIDMVKYYVREFGLNELTIKAFVIGDFISYKKVKVIMKERVER